MGKILLQDDSKVSHERTLAEGILYYLSVLIRYRWLIISITAFATIAMTGFCILSVRLPPERSPLPNVYTARSVIIIQQGSDLDLASTILAALGVEGRSTVPTGIDNGALLLLVLRSRAILDRIVDEYSIAKKFHIVEQERSASRELLLKKSSIEYTRTTGSISIAFKDTDPVFACNVVNRMVSLLGEWFVQNSGSYNSRQKQLLEEKTKEVQDVISGLEGHLKANAAEFSAGQRSLPDLQKEFNDLTSELEVQRKIYSTLSHQYEVLKLTPEPVPIFQILETAEVPDAKSGPQRSQIIMKAFLFSLVGSIALALISNAVKKVMNDPKMRGILRGMK